MADKSKSIWIWLGCGCATLVGLVVVSIAGLAFVGLKTAKTMADPVARRGMALDYLTAAAIPAGYEVDMAIKVPFVAELVVLQGDGTQFVYLGNLRNDADLHAAFVDEDSFDRETRRAGVKLRSGQALLARETLRMGAVEVAYALYDGEIEFDAAGSANLDFQFGEMVAEEDEVNAQISAVILLRCSAEETPGLGLWAGPRANPDGEAEDATADAATLRGFVVQFEFCPG